MKLKPTCNINWLTLSSLLIGTLLCTEAFAGEVGKTAASAVSSTPPVFAQVGKVVITQREFDGAFAAASRNRFYHGKPPEAEVAALQREIGDKLVTDALLVIEAKRLKLKPDAELIKQKLEQFEKKNSGNEQWLKVRDRVLPIMTRQFEDETLRHNLEQRTRKVNAPNEKQLRAYYTAHPDKFTEPEQLRVAVILLGVDPSSPQAAWDTARNKAEDLVKKLRDGADFAEMAKLYSSDAPTVDEGGDMGYLHGGMLPPLSQETVSKLKPGEISEPVAMMEGMAIFKLIDHKEAKLNGFDKVKPRAGELYLIDEGERAWKTLIAQLKKKTSIQVNESHFLPLPKPATEPVAPPPAQPVDAAK